MEIKLHLPSQFEADVKFDADRRILTVTPRLIRPGKAPQVTLAGYESRGQSGRVSRGLALLSTKTGHVTVVRETAQENEPVPFDTPANAAVPTKPSSETPNAP